MYLKKVEVFGFKSFADKTVLLLDKGITAIVGPNGCGKSNISEAISWCLGEQRAKNIRLPSMQSVIFGGTQKRAAMGMAEVSLTFDNSQNVLPIDYSEVLITRKLFRSGESQYFINKNQCRLKDVRDLFLDTGIGPDGYSIIPQGKVDFLVSSITPEDRRALFEEAAGIAKYKARREETQKRLEKVEADMARLSDALSLQKEQINILDKQARKAKQYKKYQEELKKYEAADLVWHINFGQEQIKQIKETLDPIVKEFEINTVSAAQTEAEIADMRLNHDQKNDEYVALNGELNDIRTKISVSDQIVQSAMERENELRQEQENLSAQLSENREKTSQYQRELNDTGADDAALMTEIQNLETDFKNKEQKFGEIKGKVSSFSLKESEIRAKLSEIENQKERQINAKTQSSDQYIRLDAENASVKRMLERLESDIEPSNNEIAALESEMNEALKETEQKTLSQEELDKEIAANEMKESKLQEEMSELKNNIASNEGSIEVFRDFDKSNPIRLAMRAVIDIGAARGPISGLIDMDPQNEDIAALALGDKLDYLVCKDSAAAQKAINYLEENDFAKLTFIIEDKVPEIKELARLALPSGSAELIKLLKFDRADEKIIRFLCSNSIVSGGTIYSESIVCGGGKIVSEKPVLIEDKIKRLEDKNEEIKRLVLELEKNIEQTQEDQIKLKLRKDEIFKDIAKLNAQVENKKEQIDEKKFDISGYLDESKNHNAALESNAVRLRALSDEIALADGEISKLSASEDSLNTELANTEKELFDVRKEEEVLSPLLMEARSAFERKRSEFENKLKGARYIQENLDNTQRQVEFAVNKTAENETKISELLNSQNEEAEKITALHEDRAEKEAQIQICLSDKDELQRAIDDKNESLFEMRKNTEALNGRINDLQVELKNFEFQSENLNQKLAEIYGASLEQVKDEFGDTQANKEEVARLKRLMEGMGAINQAAPEEYDEKEQRYNYLIEQQKDLLSSRDDLQNIIRKINDSTIENFRKTFDFVRDNFQKIYAKLFDGGAADLKLLDESNLLETGIDIFVQPPGKKFQSLSSFSGGEKALTAIALLFAFFMVKASPFCILDEVDASLDEANLLKYNKAVKEFAQDIQFLVITHQNMSMENADVLYGVTQEEQGISIIVSAKIAKTEQSAG